MDIENPVAIARAQEGYSLERLGKRLDLSKQYLSRTEKATYAGLNKELVGFVADVLCISRREVMRRYYDYQREVRQATVLNLNPPMLSRRASREEGYVIFKKWRSSYWSSPVAFSNGMCVHPEGVNNYEDGVAPAMPEQVYNVLKEVGLLDPLWRETAPKRPEVPVAMVKVVEASRRPQYRDVEDITNTL